MWPSRSVHGSVTISSRVSYTLRRSFFSFGKSDSVSSSTKNATKDLIATREAEVMSVLREVVEPITKRHLTSLGCVQSVRVKEDSVKVELDLLVPGYTHTSSILDEINSRLGNLSWVADKSTTPTIIVKTPSVGSSHSNNALSNVRHVIGVSSCKGGVGKSTVSVNLATALANRGLKVGILDADIYGPSLPLQLSPPVGEEGVKRSPRNDKFVLPLPVDKFPNLKMLSFGHVSPKSGAPGAGGKSAAMVRGPIATRVITQLLMATDWGELDYLVVDMPPGTGDIQITLSQTAHFSGAVIVTTPHVLSLMDAAKGVDMFRAVNIPSLGLVENMAYFECAGEKHYIFGEGGRDRLLQILEGGQVASPDRGGLSATAEQISAAPYVQVPITKAISAVQLPTTPGNPVVCAPPAVVADPTSQESKPFIDLAGGVIDRLFELQCAALATPTVSLDRSSDRVIIRYFTATEAAEFFLSSAELRAHDPQTGRKLENPGDVLPIDAIDIKGHFGVGVTWKDRSDIYPFDVLRNIIDELHPTN